MSKIQILAIITIFILLVIFIAIRSITPAVAHKEFVAKVPVVGVRVDDEQLKIIDNKNKESVVSSKDENGNDVEVNFDDVFYIADRVILEDYIKETAKKYEVDPQTMINTIKCESQFKIDAIGKAGEIGIAQFMPSTWKYFSSEFGLSGDIYNPFDQVDMMAVAFSKNLQSHWTCYRKLYS